MSDSFTPKPPEGAVVTARLLSWSTIQQEYGGKWVELVDVEWDGPSGSVKSWDPAFWHLDEARARRWHPYGARVRHVAEHRHELLKLVARVGMAKDSTILFVNPVKSLTGLVVEQSARAAAL